MKIYKWNQPSACAHAAHPMLPQSAKGVLHRLHQNRQLAWLAIEGPWSTLAGLYLEQIKLVSRAFVGAPFLALQSALNQEKCSLVGGRRSCRTRRRTVLKPQYFYMHNIIEWYRNVIQRMHAYQWQQLEQSWCGAWLGPVP